MENPAFAPFSIIFSNIVFERRQKVLSWSKGLKCLPFAANIFRFHWGFFKKKKALNFT